MALNLDIGDEVTLSATILKLLQSGRASVEIPSYDFPFAIDPPANAKPGDRVAVNGHVTGVDLDNGRITIKVGGLVTVDIVSVLAWKPSRNSSRRTKKRCASCGGTLVSSRLAVHAEIGGIEFGYLHKLLPVPNRYCMVRPANDADVA